MLVLSRKVGEAVVIGDQIRVIVVSSSNGRVRLGIEAPGDVTVHRQEVDERIRAGIPPPQPQPQGAS
jgi:carbon storage regulator